MAKYFSACGMKADKVAIAHSPASSLTSLIAYARIKNASGGTINVGLGIDVHNSKWSAGQWVAVGTTFTDDTTDAQDAGANDFALTTLTNSDGLAIKCSEFPESFVVVAIDVGTAAAGGAPAYAYRYHNGTDWQALTLIDTPDFSGTGLTYLSFVAPADIALATPSGTGYSSGYWIRMVATTAPTGTAALATSIDVYTCKLMENLTNGSTLIYDACIPLYCGDMNSEYSKAEDVVVYYGTAHASNSYNLVGQDMSAATHAWKGAMAG